MGTKCLEHGRERWSRAGSGGNFRAGSDSKSYRSTCRRCIGDSGIDQSFATAPLPPDRCRILPWKITVKGLPEGTRLGAPLTVIFARRQDARREEDGPVRSCRHGHWGALRTGPPACGCGDADRRQRRARWASARRARLAAAQVQAGAPYLPAELWRHSVVPARAPVDDFRVSARDQAGPRPRLARLGAPLKT